MHSDRTESISPDPAARRFPLPGRLPAVFLAALLLTALLCPIAAGVTLVSRSAGLADPDKEEGSTELELADFNGDGHLDLVSVGDHGSPYFNSGEHGIMVWLGNGAGNWTVHQSGDFGYGGCAAGDLDRDGKMDLAWGIHHDYGSAGFGDRLLGAALGDGSGTSWTPWGTGLATNGEDWGMFATGLADFDADGLLDILSQSFGGGNGVRLYKNHGDGSWSQVWALTGGSVSYTLETGDINADGYPDFACTRSGTPIFFGDGAFGFTGHSDGLPASLRGVDLGDMNGDGRDDLVCCLGGGGVGCYTWDQAGETWIAASDGLPAAGNYARSQFGDVDGDGLLDIVVYAGPDGAVFLGDGSGSWTADATWTMPSPGDASALRVDGDTDHDGREDIVVLASKSGFPFYRNQLRVYSPWLEPATLAARVTGPTGGETFRNGSIREIRWLAAIPPAQGPAEVEIRLSLNGESGPWTTIASGLPDNGRYQWRVRTARGSDHCRIRVVAATTSDTVSATSAGDFKTVGEIIVPPGHGLDEKPDFGEKPQIEGQKEKTFQRQ